MCGRVDVKEACPSACGVCCGDDSGFKFKAEGGKMQKCGWIAKQPDKRIDECGKKKVKAACQLTCGNCTPPSPSSGDGPALDDD